MGLHANVTAQGQPKPTETAHVAASACGPGDPRQLLADAGCRRTAASANFSDALSSASQCIQLHAVAVRPGDMAAALPEPQAYALMLMGVAALRCALGGTAQDSLCVGAENDCLYRAAIAW